MPLRIPLDVFSRITDGFIVYWRLNGRHYLAYREDGLQVIEANSLEELLNMVKDIDFIEAKGVCIYRGEYYDPDGDVECLRAGFKGREIVEFIRGP